MFTYKISPYIYFIRKYHLLKKFKYICLTSIYIALTNLIFGNIQQNAINIKCNLQYV